MAEKRTQYTIRGIDKDVDQALRSVAEARHLSLNAYLVQELGRIAALPTHTGRHHDLDFAIGSMSDGNLVDNALKCFEQVDEALWK